MKGLHCHFCKESSIVGQHDEYRKCYWDEASSLLAHAGASASRPNIQLSMTIFLASLCWFLSTMRSLMCVTACWMPALLPLPGKP